MRRLVNLASCGVSVFVILAITLLNISLLNAATQKEKATKAAISQMPKTQTVRQVKPQSSVVPVQPSAFDLKLMFDSLGISKNPRLRAALVTGIPVPPNALGDMNQDGRLNVWDLLRIRNIALGIGAPPTPYEQTEGDLNRDHSINQLDVSQMRDILFSLLGAPFVVDSLGGHVLAHGIDISVPLGALHSKTYLSIAPLTQEYLTQKYGINFTSEAADSNWVMSAFRFSSDSALFLNSPVSMTIRPDSIPPCSLRAVNSLYRLGPDIDGDGIPDVVYAGNLTPSADSSALTLDIPSNPTLEGIGAISNTKTIAAAFPSVLYTGQVVRLTGSNLSKKCVLHFVDRPDSLEFAQGLMYDGLGWFTIVPPHPHNMDVGGVVDLYVEDRATGLTSQVVTGVSIAWSNSVPNNPDSIISSFFDRILNAEQMTIDSIQRDSVFSASDRTKISSNANQALNAFPNIRESALTLPANIRNQLANMLQMSSQPAPYYRSSDAIHSPEGCQLDCFWTQAKDYVVDWLTWKDVEYLLEFYECPVCIAILNWKDILTFWQPYYELGKCIYHCPDPDLCPPNYKLDPDPNKDYMCPNVLRHRPKVCVEDVLPLSPTPDPSDLGTSYHGPLDSKSGHGPVVNQLKSRRQSGSSATGPSSTYRHPLMGAIVKASQRLPFGSYGVIDGSGAFQLPGLPINSHLTLSIYDPKSGLYDPDVGGVTTGNDLDKNVVYSPLMVFNPDTTFYRFPMAIGDQKIDSISPSIPRVEYDLAVSSSQVGDTVDFGFGSTQPMTAWFRDPDSTFLVRDSSTDCSLFLRTVLAKQGVYTITVTYGVSGGDGPYVVGLVPYPYPPTHYLCGVLSYDSLMVGSTPYFVKVSPNILSDDSIKVKPGVTIDFGQGGSLTCSGLLYGYATSTSPIRLGPGTPPTPVPSRPNLSTISKEVVR